MHTAKALLEAGYNVHGVDNFAPFYDPQLKPDRLAQLKSCSDFTFEDLDLAKREKTRQLFDFGAFDLVVHLAAQAGVRYSLEHPEAFIDNNVVSFGNVLKGCRHTVVQHLIYASSSSVYGRNQKIPFVETDPVWSCPLACTPPPSEPMSSWLNRTITYLDFHAWVCGSLQSTVPGAGRIWPILKSPNYFMPVKPSPY